MVGMLVLGRNSLSSRAAGTGWTPDAGCGIASLEKRKEKKGLVPKLTGRKESEYS